MFSKKQIWKLLIPLMVEQLLTSLMGTADTMMVSHAGSAAISAVSLVDAVNILLIHVFSAMATGGAIICAQYLGRGEKKNASDTGGQLIVTVLLFSAAVTAAVAALRIPLLHLIFGRVEADVMSNADTYLLITALSYPFIALYNAGAALFRVDGNSRLPMVVSTLCNLVNIALNAFLIFVLHLGVAGAALATLVSRILCAAAILIFLRQPRQSIVVRDYVHIRLNIRRILNILVVGIPTGIENGMFQFGKLAIQSTVSTLGTTAIAAQAMTNVIEGVTSYGQIGIGLGMMTIVGQCMGAGRKDEAEKYIKLLTKYSYATTLIVCISTSILVKPITIISGMEPAVAQMCIWMTYVVNIVKPFVWAMAFTPAYGLRAAGDVRYSMIASATVMWLCRVVIATVLIRGFGFGPIGVWIGMFCDWIVRGTLYFLRFRSGRWATKQVIRS